MKRYIPTNLGFGKDNITSIVNNLQLISASILDIISVVARDRDRVKALESQEIITFTTTGRPTSTEKTVVFGVNTTTNKINYTIDGGATWYNADGTGA